MQKTSSTKGFTLVEVLVAIGLFTVVSTIAASVLVDVVQLQKKSSIQNEIYEDARILMQQLTNEIQSGTVDYEEYYSNYVIQKKNPVVPDDRYYGINYGVYSSRFFDPGKSLYLGDTDYAVNPDDLGIECSYPADISKNCEIYFSDSTDLNTGQNPYKNNPGLYVGSDANAFCDKVVGVPATCPNGNNPLVTFDNSASGYYNAHVKELYLIDSTGMHKTIVAQKNMNATGACGANGVDCAVGMVKMTGQDLDQNGIIDVFGCDTDYKCFQGDNTNKIYSAFKYSFIAKDKTPDLGQKYLVENNISLPQFTDLAKVFDNASQFVPITPRRANVKALNFTINPVDDPYKAYAETAMQTQPTVTISMTIGLASAYKADYPGAFPDITLQTTVTAGVIGKIDSYPPVNDILRSNVDSWIKSVF